MGPLLPTDLNLMLVVVGVGAVGYGLHTLYLLTRLQGELTNTDDDPKGVDVTNPNR